MNIPVKHIPNPQRIHVHNLRQEALDNEQDRLDDTARDAMLDFESELASLGGNWEED